MGDDKYYYAIIDIEMHEIITGVVVFLHRV